MRAKKKTYIVYTLRCSVFAACVMASACNTGLGDETSETTHTTENDQSTVNSLIKSISKDTIALSNYLALSVSTGDVYATINVYETLGTYFRDTYQYERAINYHRLSLEAAQTSQNKLYEIHALNDLAFVYEQIAAYNESAEYYFRSLSQFNKLKQNEPRQLQSENARTLNGLGKIYLHIHQSDEAIRYFKNALALEKKLSHEAGQAINLELIGAAYESDMLYDSARAYYNKSLNHHIKSNSISGLNRCFERIGNLYMITGDYENALVYLESAYQSLRHTSDKLNWLNACLSLGDVYTRTGNYQKAEIYLNEGLQASKTLNLSDYLERVYFLLSELHKQQGKAMLALEERTVSDFYARIFRSEKNTNMITLLRINYEKEMNELEKNRLKAQHKIREEKKQNTINATFLFIIILIVVIFILNQNNQHRKKKNQTKFQLEKLKSGFYINLTQEFKIPASIIIGMVERLKKSLEDDIKKISMTDLDILTRQTENLFLLINEIATVDNLREGNEPKKMMNGNIIAYFRYLFEYFSTLAETKKINCVFQSNVSEMHMDYFPEYLHIIMHNLLSNAMKYCTENETITVNVNCNLQTKNCTLEVSDTGIGICKNDLPNIFELHYQGTNEKIRRYDSGVGLTITKQLVEKMNGTIAVKSEPKKKTVFTVVFPMHNGNFLQHEAGITIHKPANISSQKIGNEFTEPAENNELPVILIVEENTDMNYFLSSALKDKYTILTEGNGETAVKTAHSKVPDIIIADNMLPFVNGFLLCKELKQSLVTNHVPVILLTNDNSRSERIRGFEYGADAFLSKPVYEDELMAVIDQLLSNRKQLREKYYANLRLVQQQENVHGQKNDVNLDFLQRITNLIYKDITNTENIFDKLSSDICLSSSQLNRKMKAITGLTTTNYILKTRLNKAKKLLTNTPKPIGDIAMECGFNDFAYFSRSFKKEFGMTPTSFQRLPQSLNLKKTATLNKA